MKKMPIALVLVLALLLLMTCETDVVNVGYANFFPAPVPEHNFEVKGSGDVMRRQARIGFNKMERSTSSLRTSLAAWWYIEIT